MNATNSTKSNSSSTSKPTGLGMPKKKSSDKVKPEIPAALKGHTSVSNVAPQGAASTTTTTTTTKERKAKLPIARQVQRKIKNLVKRWTNIQARTKGWDAKFVESLKDVEDLLLESLKQAGSIPDDFVAPKKSGGGGAVGPRGVEVGSIIQVTDKARPKYDGILEAAEMRDLSVLVIGAGKVRCRTKDGKGTLVFPRGHVALQKAAAETTEEEAAGEE